MINNKQFKSSQMFKFIYKYNSNDNFFSDNHLLWSIGKSIDLKELSEKEDILKEFNECRFYNKIKDSKISYYIEGVLSQIKTFELFSLFFKYIYQLKKDQEEDKNDNNEKEKNKKASNSIISYFISLLKNLSSIQINENFKEILQKVIILSVKYIEEKQKNDYVQVISDLGNYCNFLSTD